MLSDTTFCGVAKFLKEAELNQIRGIVGLRVGTKTYIAKNTHELKQLFKAYNTKDIVELDKNFQYITQPPIYFLPGQEEYFNALCDYFGRKPERVGNAKDFEKFKLNIDGDFRYDLRSNQRLYHPLNDDISKFIKEEKEYPERLRYEINIIKEFGYEDYFHTVKRIVDIANVNGIEIGPGRGSVVGSLLAYRMGITKINPLKYDLLFERFMNEGRRDYPDIDLDVEDTQRQNLLKLLRKEFKVVYNISAFATIPEKILKEYGTLASYLSDIPVQRTTHAAGVIISTTEIDVPLVQDTETIEWDMKDLEGLGYVKFDILGLKTLTIFKELRKYSKNTTQDISENLYEDTDSIMSNDNGKKTYRYIAAGFTDNVFQLDSSIAKQVVRDLKPNNFNELVLAISLNRPGPLRAGITKEIRQLKVRKSKKYNVPVLSETYGLPIYQEQVMKIAMELAGLTSAQADELRKAIAKKDMSKIRETYEKLRNKLTELYGNEGKELSKIILTLGEYAFNKSHAVAYAHITYFMAYYKANYPKMFYDIYLRYDTTILPEVVYNLQALGYLVFPPKLKFSKVRDKEKEDIYHLPLYIAPGISVEKADNLKEMTFETFEDFVEFSGLSLSNVEALIKIGTFDEIFESRRKAIQKLRSIRSGINPELARIGGKLFGKVVQKEELKVEDDWERTQMEYDILGVAMTPPTKVDNLLAPYSLAYSLDLPFGIHVGVKAGFGTDGKSIFKIHIPDGEYTMIYPNTYEVGRLKVEYLLDEEPLKNEISKSSYLANQNGYGYEKITLPDGRSIENARPIKNGFKTVFIKD
ncbi:DNA polymerase III subunit alpha [Fervidobacterium sp.]